MHDIIHICLSNNSYLIVRLLSWQNSEASNTPHCINQSKWLDITTSLRTPANPTEVEAIVTVIVAVNAYVHTTIQGPVVVVAVTQDILKSPHNRLMAST